MGNLSNPDDIAGQSEHSIQCALMAAVAQCVPQAPELAWLFAIPNGGSRDQREAGNLKAEGVKPGVADLLLPVPSRGYHGFFIEMKNLSGVQSDSQKAFEKFVTEQGYLYAVFRTLRDAFNGLIWYLSLESSPVARLFE